MASNELAAILARRRMKIDGMHSEAEETPKSFASSSSESINDTKPNFSSFKEKNCIPIKHEQDFLPKNIYPNTGSAKSTNIDVEKKQEIASTKTNDIVSKAKEASSSIPTNLEPAIVINQPITVLKEHTTNIIDDSTPISMRKTSATIQRLQGNLGSLNMNALKPGGAGFLKKSAASAPDNSTIEDSGPWVAIPGMAKEGTPIPGMATLKEDLKSPQIFHTSMTRASGPRRRQPTGQRSQLPSFVTEHEDVTSSLSSEVVESNGARDPKVETLLSSPTNNQTIASTSLFEETGEKLPPTSPASCLKEGQKTMNAMSSTSSFREEIETNNMYTATNSSVLSNFKDDLPEVCSINPTTLPVKKFAASLFENEIKSEGNAKESNSIEKTQSSTSLFGSDHNLFGVSHQISDSTVKSPTKSMTKSIDTSVGASLFGDSSESKETVKISTSTSLFGNKIDIKESIPTGTSNPSSLFGNGGHSIENVKKTTKTINRGQSLFDESDSDGEEPVNELNSKRKLSDKEFTIPSDVSSSDLFGNSSSSLFGDSKTEEAVKITPPTSAYQSLFGGLDDSEDEESEDEGGLFGTGLPK